MKLEIKITGWSEGKRKSIRRTVETPVFEFATKTLLGRTWTESEFEQQVRWVDENYETVVIPLAEEAYFWPIEGFAAIEPKVKIDKRQQVIEYAETLLADWTVEMKEIFLVSLTAQWPQVKNLAIEQIFKIVFATIDVSTSVAIQQLKGISGVLNSDETQKLIQ